MAVPTITSLSVTTGPTQGRTLVAITGTNFRPYPVIPATGRVPKPRPTVRILFGAEEAVEVQTESTTKVWCLTPTADPGLTSVTVTNLDAQGVPVAGETVVKADAYTFVRPYIRVPSTATSVDRYRGDLHRLVIKLVQEWRRQVLDNTVLKKPNKDYANLPASDRVRLASLPGAVLYGPRLSPNRFLSSWEYEAIPAGETQFKARRPVEARDVAFSFSIVADSQFEALNLIEVVDRFFDKFLTISLLKDPANPSRGQASYDVVYTDIASMSTDIDGDNQAVIEGGFFIRGFEMQSSAGFVDDAVESIGDTVSTIEAPTLPTED